MLVLRYICICCILCLTSSVFSQDNSATEKQEPPDLKSNRADEDYSYLKDPDHNPYKEGFADDIKFIPLNTLRTAYMSIGGQYRPRFEYTNNVNYGTANEHYYSQRLNVHGNMVLGNNIRVFGEFFHGYTSDRQRLLETDHIDVHQAFIEYKTQTQKNNSFSFRLGRQELALGASRLVGNREGPNMRRSFDLAKICYQINQLSLTVFYGKEVDPQFGAFDNAFSLFDSDAINPELWGIGTQFPIKNLNGTNELYYLGFRSKAAGFSDVFGEELRHSIGIRRFGSIGKRISYNTEIIYQFGDLDGSRISALNIETDWKYKLINTKWHTTLGLKFDWSTGDKATGDGKLQTFNPLFVNPAIYSLAAVNTPANLNSFHPNLTIYPIKHLSIYMDYAVFFRTSKEDGLYTPPRFQIRTANGISEKHIGDAFGMQVNYQFNRNIAFDLRTSYFIPGKFIEASGESESIFYIAPTLNFKF